MIDQKDWPKEWLDGSDIGDAYPPSTVKGTLECVSILSQWIGRDGLETPPDDRID